MDKKLSPREVLGKSKIFRSLDEDALALLEQRMKLTLFFYLGLYHKMDSGKKSIEAQKFGILVSICQEVLVNFVPDGYINLSSSLSKKV